MTPATERFLKAISYPERVDSDGAASTLLVDGLSIRCEDKGGRIVLSWDLGAEAAGVALPQFARYAAGRILKEDAVLAYGRMGASTTCFLWQDAPSDAGAGELVRLFETFMDSCDWWRERIKGRSAGAAEPTSEEKTMVIRP